MDRKFKGHYLDWADKGMTFQEVIYRPHESRGAVEDLEAQMERLVDIVARIVESMPNELAGKVLNVDNFKWTSA
jgi:hypothetical protein